MQESAPVVLFVYNRPEHTKSVLESLDRCDKVELFDLFIFSDGEKNKDDEKVRMVRDIIDHYSNYSRFKSVKVIKSTKNKGLANSVISSITSIITEKGSVIVLEDDLVVSKDFLLYMQGALDYYRNVGNVWSITAYSPRLNSTKEYPHDIFYCERAGSWGWATWKDRWDKIDWSVSDYNKFKSNWHKRFRFSRRGPDLPKLLDLQMSGQIDSWATIFCYQQFIDNSFTVYPCVSKVDNIGFDGAGTHSPKGDYEKWHNDINLDTRITTFEILEVNKKIKKEFNRYYIYPIHKRLMNKMNKVITMVRTGMNSNIE